MEEGATRCLVMRHLLVQLALLGGLSAAVSPLPAQSWVATTAPSTNWGSIACSADGNNLVAGAGQNTAGLNVAGLIYVSHDSGATWAAADVPAGQWLSVASSADGTTLLAADYLNGLVYSSHDSGATWSSNNVPNEAWYSVACSADGTISFAAALEGSQGFGSAADIYASMDSGATWAQTGAPPGNWDSVASSADGTKLAALELGNDGLGNVWTSTNSGAAWHLAFSNPFANWDVTCSADGTKMAAGSSGGTIFTSMDSGNTWTTNAGPNYSLYWMFLGCSADGSTLVIDGIAAFPAGGYSAGVIFLSSDSGASWVQAPDQGLVPADWSGIAISADGCKLVGAVTAFSSYSVSASPGGIFTLQFTPSPALSIVPSDGGLVLSWTVPSVNFGLQQNPDLAATNWTDVPGTPALDYSTLRSQVTLPAPPGPMFYRLISR